MSAIAGFIAFDGEPADPALLARMAARLAKRGPDGNSTWIHGSAALVHLRLDTTPESLEETQPLVNEDRSIVLVMDGRIDNWETLRAELIAGGAHLRTRADAELVLRAYETWGEDFDARIDGDYAIVIWDVRKQVALCVRDRLGNRQLNYHWDGRVFAFATELHALFCLPSVPHVSNEGWLAECLAGQWLSRDESPWRGILRLLPAHRMKVSTRGAASAQYWAPDLHRRLSLRSETEYAEQYLHLFTDTVRRMSRSHRSVACEVSGGLDSSAIFCIANRLLHNGQLPAPQLKGYTFAIDDDSAANELAYAREVGQFLGVPIQEVPPAVRRVSWYRASAAHYQEFPGYVNATMCINLLAQARDGGCIVVLTGEGGDEWVGGGPTYYAEAIAERDWRAFTSALGRDATAFGPQRTAMMALRHGIWPLLPNPVRGRIKHLSRSLGRRPHARSLAQWLSPHLRDVLRARHEQYPPDQRPLPRAGQRALLGLLQDAEIEMIMARSDRLGGRLGIDYRHPFRSKGMVEFAFATPEHLRLRGHLNKYLHRKSLVGTMPQLVLERTTKAYFNSISRRQVEALREIFTNDLPRRRADWLSDGQMRALFDHYVDNPQIGWPYWILWGFLGADVLSSSAKCVT